MQIFIISMMILLIHAGLAYSQSSLNYQITAGVIPGGGVLSSSASYALASSIGQSSSIGNSSSSGYGNSAGFWYVAEEKGCLLPGDSNGDGQVTIDEVQKGINQFLGISSVEPCFDLNGNDQVSIDEVQKVINAFLGINQ